MGKIRKEIRLHLTKTSLKPHSEKKYRKSAAFNWQNLCLEELKFSLNLETGQLRINCQFVIDECHNLSLILCLFIIFLQLRKIYY